MEEDLVLDGLRNELRNDGVVRGLKRGLGGGNWEGSLEGEGALRVGIWVGVGDADRTVGGADDVIVEVGMEGGDLRLVFDERLAVTVGQVEVAVVEVLEEADELGAFSVVIFGPLRERVRLVFVRESPSDGLHLLFQICFHEMT